MHLVRLSVCEKLQQDTHLRAFMQPTHIIHNWAEGMRSAYMTKGLYFQYFPVTAQEQTFGDLVLERTRLL